MKKFKASQCKNFEPIEITNITDLQEGIKHVYLCNQRKCLDSKECDHYVKDIFPEVHFEPKLEEGDQIPNPP